MLHEKGFKGERDRARLIHSYTQMVKEFRVKDRITPDNMAKMTNAHIFQACRDLYNGTTIKKAKRLAKKLGVYQERKVGIISRIKAVFHG